MRAIACRLTRGDDLYESLRALAVAHELLAGVIVCGVGCVSRACVRNAGATEIKALEGPLEIVSLTGTLSKDRVHAHIALSDSALHVFGGHLKPGCIVDTTCELVIAPLDKLAFQSEFDADTGYNEIKILAAEE